MQAYFTEEEREAFRRVYLDAARHVLGVFKVEPPKLEELVRPFQSHCDLGLDLVDVTLGNASEDRKKELEENGNRQKLVDIINYWVSLPYVNFTLVSHHLLDQLEIQKDKVKGSLTDNLDHALETIVLMRKATAVAERFPFLFVEDQLNGILTADKDDLNTLKPQIEFLEGLTWTEISSGKLDYRRINELMQHYSSFTPTLLTLADLREAVPVLKEGYSFFPIIHRQFNVGKRYDFRGIVTVLPNSLHQEITSLDPRSFEYGLEAIRLKSWITTLILSTHKGTSALRGTCELIKEGEYDHLQLLISRNVFLNIGAAFGNPNMFDREDPREYVNLLLAPEKPVSEMLGEVARGNYIPITPTALKEAAREISSVGFIVGYRFMRMQQQEADVNKVPKGQNPGISLLYPPEAGHAYSPLLGLYISTVDHDLNRILKEGPRKMREGGKFYHANRDFFQRFKAGKLEKSDVEKRYHLAKAIAEKVDDPAFKEFIETTIRGIDCASRSLFEGRTNPDILHYLSKRNNPMILVEQVNGFYGGEILLGYSMNICLKILDLMRYHGNPNTRISCFWLDGIRVGMSYDILVSRDAPVNEKDPSRKPHFDPLVDSIELGDQFLGKMGKFYGVEGGKEEESPLINGFIITYLQSRLQTSERGIYVIPESNNLIVRRAMRSWVEVSKGVPLLHYEGPRVKTDTEFDRIPYWVDKSALGETEVKIIGESGLITPEQFAAQGSGILDPEAVHGLQQTIARIMHSKTGGKA
jgi:hypothetical protein